MKAWHWFFSVCLAMTLSIKSLAGDRSLPHGKWLFDHLAAHPDFHASLYRDQALILKRGEQFYAAFATVSHETYPLLCAYAAVFNPSIGLEPGRYIFKPRYYCDHTEVLKPYTGLFEIKYPPCGGEICPNPAIGVGNLMILPEFDFSLEQLPVRLPGKIDGRIEHAFDSSLPIAGVPAIR